MPGAEILVAADGAVEDCGPLAAASSARVVVTSGPSGPATARNAAAAQATGDLLAFVDADVVVAPDALPGMCGVLETERELAGIFGAYDRCPLEPNFMSQYKNLSHAYVHETGSAVASTFWAGLGAIRADVFRTIGGFDERFRRPSVEDIELGYRLVAAGYPVRLDARFRGRHLKRWTLRSSVSTDIVARGIPWTQLIYRSRTVANDLNTSSGLRWSVVLAVALATSLAATGLTWWAAIVAITCGVALVVLNFPYYRWFVKNRGIFFATRVIPLHVLHHLCNGLSFVVGTALYLFARIGIHLPGALPTRVWAPQTVSAEAPPQTRSAM